MKNTILATVAGFTIAFGTVSSYSEMNGMDFDECCTAHTFNGTINADVTDRCDVSDLDVLAGRDLSGCDLAGANFSKPRREGQKRERTNLIILTTFNRVTICSVHGILALASTRAVGDKPGFERCGSGLPLRWPDGFVCPSCGHEGGLGRWPLQFDTQFGDGRYDLRSDADTLAIWYTACWLFATGKESRR